MNASFRPQAFASHGFDDLWCQKLLRMKATMMRKDSIGVRYYITLFLIMPGKPLKMS
jgi:hypothetical protein